LTTGDFTNEECQIRAAWGLFIILNKELNEDPSNNMPSKMEIRPIIDAIGSMVVGKNTFLAFASHDIISAFCHSGLIPSIGLVRILSINHISYSPTNYFLKFHLK
jgi:hypothetical protein